MANVDDINDIFKLMNKIMNSNFSGGFRVPTGEGFYTNQYNEIKQEEGIIHKSDKLEILEDAKNVYFTMELRGVSEEDLKVTPKKDSIDVDIMINGQKISETFNLNREINPKATKITFKDCILDVILKKKRIKNVNKKDSK